jgi:predicted ATP-grasp superfamily ATP-dependent carboligase
MKRVLLTCARIPTGLFLARALHKAGAEVHIADPFQVHICKASNSVNTCHKITSPITNKAAYKEEILDIITTYKIDLVIPVFEDGIFLSEFYNEIASKCNILLADFNLLLQLHNKFDFITLANKLGFSTPATYKYDFPTENFEFIKNTKYIVKKIFSRSGSGVEIFEAGEKINPTLQPNGEYVIQEFITGQMVCTCSYVHNGKLLLHTTYKQLIATPNGTAAICFQAIEDMPIQKSIELFVSKINYTGWISFDIIKKSNGDFFYIECNPRTSLGICLFNPKILAKTLLEASSDIKFQNAVTIGAKAQIALVSIECVLRRLFKGSLQFKELKSLMTSEDIIFDRSDLYPYIYQFACYIYVKYIALKLKTSFLYAGTYDLEWN